MTKCRYFSRTVGHRVRPLSHSITDPRGIFEAVPYVYWPRPTQNGLTVGRLCDDIKGLVSHEVVYDRRVDDWHC